MGIDYYINKVSSFHKEMGIEPCGWPLPTKRAVLRAGLILEESLELTEANQRKDIVNFASELADLVYVTAGFFAETELSPATDRGNIEFPSEASVLMADMFKKQGAMLRQLSYDVCHFVREQFNAMEDPGMDESVKSASSLLRFCSSKAYSCGIPFLQVFDAVHEANMRKAGGPKDPVTGKQLKPHDWHPADVTGILASCFIFP